MAMRWQTWFNKYKPVQCSEHSCYAGLMFETYGKEIERLHKLADEHKIDGKNGYHIWTLVEGDNGRYYILNGWHYVNRLGYFFTEVPWIEGESIEVST